MLFNSPVYGVFLLVTYVVYWGLRRHRLPRTIFLAIASYLFYVVGTYDAATEQEVPFGAIGWTALCVAIIFLGSSLDFFIGKKLGRTEDPTQRKALLLVSIVYYLGVLAVFKYFNFFVDSFASLAHALGAKGVEAPHLRLVLPFGISFFTFETMSYTIDVYRREIEPSNRYVDYLLFVAFFPHLVAGPIVRPKQMLPQLAAEPVATDQMKAEGLFLIATGLMKKIVIGDTLGINLVNRVFEQPTMYSSLEVLVGVYAYAIKIYADFSGYTDVARGSAKLFGLELPLNFDAPYIARNLQDFWHRWHISLSTWLRDYLYVPLGGNRHGTLHTYRNLWLTMVLGGLWHGASWNFVIWGALHGTMLGINRAWQRAGLPGVPRAVAIVLTFHFVCFAWIFFRAPTFEHATLVIGRLARGTLHAPNLAPKVMAALALGFATQLFPRGWLDRVREQFVRLPAVAQGVTLAAAAYVLHFAAAAKAEPFIYGQF
jgi:D-alanyl-lipoteichoic acid acyltransferase DltB (MBOAT superfamily)